jgi:curved DNA-binding protein CbpA
MVTFCVFYNFINTLDASEAYKILGLAVTATIKEVKKKYRELVLKWHPDRNRTNQIQAEKELVKINQAYETIMAAA